jgi:N6-adenosine-specific RNA methylase IME4
MNSAHFAKQPARVLVADPPWKFKDRLPGRKRGAAKHYGCLTPAEICAFALPPLCADGALLFLWRVAAMQQEALDVVEAWGFKVKAELVWVKLTSTSTKLHFGMGRYTRAAHETCLICTRGRASVRVHDQRSIFFAPVGRHSEKPDAFYLKVARLAAGPYAELFARRRRPGWRCFGNELEPIRKAG